MTNAAFSLQQLRRHSGAPGAPTSLGSGVIFQNDVDGMAYMGVGDDGTGKSTSQVPIGTALFVPATTATAGKMRFATAIEAANATAGVVMDAATTFSVIADIRQFAHSGNPFGSGGDDTAAWQAAVAWLCNNAVGHRFLRVPAGGSICAATLSGAVTGNRHIGFIVDGVHDVVFASGIDGFNITRDYAAGLVIRGVFRITRNATSGEANTAFQLNYNTSSSTSGGIPGAIEIEFIHTRAPTASAGWKWGLILVATVTANVNTFYNQSINHAYASVETGACLGGTPGAAGAGLWVKGAYQTNASFTGSVSGTMLTVSAISAGAIAAGQNLVGTAPGTTISSQASGTPGGVGTYNLNFSQTLSSTALTTTTNIYSVQTDIAQLNATGGHIGVLTSGPVQGLFADNIAAVGQDYCYFSDHVQSDVAEAIGYGDSTTFAASIENVRQNFVGNPQLSKAQHDRAFATSSTSQPWAAVHLLECNGFVIDAQYGVGSNMGSETGLYIESGQRPTVVGNGSTGSAPGSVSDFGIQLLAGPWLNLAGHTNKSIMGGSTAGVSAAINVAAQNLLSNMINGAAQVQVPGAAASFQGLVPDTNGRAIGGGGAYTWAQVWAAQIVNQNGAVVIYPAPGTGLNPAADASYSLGTSALRWTTGNFSGTITSPYSQSPPITVASLPAPQAAYTGLRTVVKDATTSAFYNVVAGGGSTTVPVFCDGANWRIG